MNLLNIFSKAKGKTNGKYESDAVKIEASQSLVYHGSHGHQVSVILFLLVSYTPNLSVVFITPTHTLYLLYELMHISPPQPNFVSRLDVDDSATDVHLCKSLMCTACKDSRRGCQFIKVEHVRTEQNTKKASSTSATGTKHPIQLIIENMPLVGTAAITVYNNQKQGHSDDELNKLPNRSRTQSLSEEDESVQDFIDSIEKGKRAFV